MGIRLEKSPPRHVRSIWPDYGQTTARLGVGVIWRFCHPSWASSRRPFSCRQEIDAGRLRFLPARRKFRPNLLDNMPCLCASLKGERESRAAGAASRPAKICRFSTMGMKTPGLGKKLRNICEIIAYSIKSIYWKGRAAGPLAKPATWRGHLARGESWPRRPYPNSGWGHAALRFPPIARPTLPRIVIGG